MPIFYQQEVAEKTRLAVWKIEEDEDFFLQRVPLQREIRHPHKRLQHLAGRYLLQHLFPDFPLSLILIADTRKPYLADDIYHFSISHCHNYAAVIASKDQRVGIDIETITEKIQRISKKFLSDEERGLLSDNNDPAEQQIDEITSYTIAWSAKEAVFKWYGLGEMDFRQHMQIQSLHEQENRCLNVSLLFTKTEIHQLLKLEGKLFPDLSLCFIAS